MQPALDVEGRTIWIVDAHGYGKRFIVRANEILTAFVELEAAIRRAKGPTCTGIQGQARLSAIALQKN